ncbi:alpha-amylase family glycosyl hydrolase [Luteimonas sp. M1R5S18]|uniref:Alpha-amylase family glycosyl hydrolase n=1 Tax=Luteimonas rhizosphaericola TaxID=3042024 RepID=A0ABT6JMP3_9GAMM|nr:alpha-amylase family glycosyl hydrolase [Luteimonas rhizosphaericola]MDH5831941.1 alpha-amylase family glycosyl hydrolase [Luteimonas rhizosphaericola]
MSARLLTSVFVLALLSACASTPAPRAGAGVDEAYGTLEPFASEAVYFVVTDRFVNGDPGNDHREQGGARRTFDIPLEPCDGVAGNIGYLGGDFRGLADNLDYIRDLGFSAVWITPVVDNPDEAFTGGQPPGCNSSLADHGKTGYHGYWGVNFFEIDEHLPSPGMGFADLAAAMRARELRLVLDIVGNHGSPAWSMTADQPKFGKVFGRDGRLLADHQNLPPQRLDPAGNPLHAFYSNVGPVDAAQGSIYDGNLAQLSDFDAANPAVLDYLVEAYSHWIDQGAEAFRIDTIGWMPSSFWKQFADRIRAKRPGFFMFGEAFDYDAANIAVHTRPENGGVSVLDFPMKQAMEEVFGTKQAGFERLAPALLLGEGPYANVYDLATFYDNHDMPRMEASDEGFIDAHNWLFTARGIPVVYYGSEVGFMRGRGEHAGNRNYFGQARIDAAPESAIHRHLRRIATLRRDTPALQRGLQVDLRLEGDTAAFYRIYQHAGTAQTALVLLNKGDRAQRITVDALVQPGAWRDAFDGTPVRIDTRIDLEVPAHGVRVLLRDAPVDAPALKTAVATAMARPRAE